VTSVTGSWPSGPIGPPSPVGPALGGDAGPHPAARRMATEPRAFKGRRERVEVGMGRTPVGLLGNSCTTFAFSRLSRASTSDAPMIHDGRAMAHVAQVELAARPAHQLADRIGETVKRELVHWKDGRDGLDGAARPRARRLGVEPDGAIVMLAQVE